METTDLAQLWQAVHGLRTEIDAIGADLSALDQHNISARLAETAARQHQLDAVDLRIERLETALWNLERKAR